MRRNPRGDGPAAARLPRVPMRPVEPEPWALGLRLRGEPSGVHQFTVTAGSAADGCTLDGLAGLPGEAWVSLVVRDAQLVPIKGGTRLQPGDDVLVLWVTDYLVGLRLSPDEEDAGLDLSQLTGNGAAALAGRGRRGTAGVAPANSPSRSPDSVPAADDHGHDSLATG